MSDRRCCPDMSHIKEAICIDTEKVYDSCADKDCLRDLRVYVPEPCQHAVDCAVGVRCRGCEILNCLVEVEKVPFNKGCFSVDLTFFIKVTVDLIGPPGCPITVICGLCVFSKKCILYGSEGSVRIFTSRYKEDAVDQPLPPMDTNPKAKVQCADPICLSAELCRVCDCCNTLGENEISVPNSVARHFDGCLGCCRGERAVKVTIGVFSIIQLTREVQILIPAYDFCVPTKDCCCDTEDPCDAFKKIKFPVDEFFPPSIENVNECNSNQNCNCGG